VVANSGFDKLQDNVAVVIPSKVSTQPAPANTSGSSAP